MTLTKKSKAELAVAYKAVMDVSILDMKAPLRYINQNVSRDVVGYGTAADEKVFSLDDYRKLITDMRKQSRGMFFKAKKTTAFQPRLIDTKTVQFMDEVSLQIGDKKNKHFVYLYITTIFKNDEGKWKMTLFHSSIPDAASSAKDTFHITEAERKLKALEQVVEERTAELQRKNKELEIEASLEKVRAAAMGLYKAGDLLHICEVLFAELKGLGFDSLRCALIHLFIEGKKYYYDYDYAAITGGKISTVTLEAPEKVAAFFEQIRSSANAFDERVYEGSDLTQLKQWRKKTGQIDDPRLKSAKRLYYYFYSVGSANIGISTFEKISDEQLQLLKRFRNVFDLAYKRYTDISNAEAQARASKIETALEKVRSRGMGMQQSEELQEVIKVVYEQLLQLGLQIDHAGFVVDYQAKADWHFWITDKNEIPSRIRVPWFKSVWGLQFDDAKEHGRSSFSTLLNFKEKNKFYQQLLSYVPGLPEESLQFYMTCPGLAISTAVYDEVSLYVENFDGKPYTEEENTILLRVGKVFQQTYTRFLDLQKAEAQAREAQIEVAVERVRARALAMHKSEDLHSVVVTLKKELRELHIPDVMAATIYLNQDDGTIRILDLSNTGNNDEGQPELAINKVFRIEDIHPKLWINRMWKRKENYFVEEANEADFKRVIDWLYTMDKAEGEIAEKIIREKKINKAWLPTVKLEKGILNIDLLQPPAPEIESILLKIGAAFDLAYKRFLDLQKAEAQAREAQIEAALERVRSRSLAMHHSRELGELVALFFEELTKLDLILYRCIIWIINPKDYSSHLWAANSEDKTIADSYFVQFIEQPYYRSIINAWKNRQPKWEYILEGEEKKNIDTILLTETELSRLPNAAKAGIRSSTKTIVSGSFNNFGFIEASGPKSHSKEQLEIVHRFGNVFDQSYTRLLDLQKAEAQAREAQIQLALERVRARTMAMQRSEELPDTSLVLYEQFKQLGEPAEQLTIGVVQEENNVIEISATVHGGVLNKIYQHSIHEPYMMNKIFRAWKGQQETLIVELKGDQLNAYNRYRNELTQSDLFPTNLDDDHRRIVYAAFFSKGMLAFASNEPSHLQSLELLKRFASVFDLTYTRFLDLKKAEKQAREAQIEAALERIRARALAMHQSAEFTEVAKVMREQMGLLGQKELETSAVHLYNEDADNIFSWRAFRLSSKLKGNISYGFFKIPKASCALTKEFVQQFKSQATDYTIEVSGARQTEWYKILFKLAPEVAEAMKKSGTTKQKRYYHFSKFPGGALLMVSSKEPTMDAVELQKRSAQVFDLAYRRFKDLQKAEAQAREAQIETALERVRSRTLAMQKSDELAGTAAVLFQQLISLGLEPNRLYIILIKENNPEMEAWVTDEDGSKVSMAFTGNQERNKTLLRMYQGWLQKKTSLLIDLQGEELQEYIHYLHNELKVPFKGGLEQKRRIQHVAYFNHGLIGMASPDEQPQDTIQLLERFAAVFNLTYTRFNDLKIAEAHALQAEQDLVEIKEARKNAEQALSELQSTQKQLIQSEKMASLGELTAGIAHEIQNPLNFVNNFSEVSKELLDELKEAIDKGDTADAKEIMNDVIQNLEKINHHGKRADGIVKGMLQHSRKNEGKKESTDINALCDEYLRLAYHGLRAKDKSFNAQMKADYDDSIRNINIVPQDIGRVILNLITNAFYAVNEKVKSERSKVNEENGRELPAVSYEPMVTVQTKQLNDKVEISVSDNGNGIPDAIKEKIFQPFFTTKPTGQGTGLGLSLSYDIIKAHGGELKMETKEGEGTEFKILLPYFT